VDCFLIRSRRYDIKGFPTIKIFAGEQKTKNGKVKKAVDDYNGQRTADAIVSHMLGLLPSASKKLQGSLY